MKSAVKTLFLLVMAVLTMSCSKPDDKPAAVFTPEFKPLPTALPFNEKLKGKAEFAVKTPDEQTVSFEVIGNERMYEAYPAVVIRGSDAPKIIELRDFLNYGWVLAGVSEDRVHIWGLLDYTVEGPDPGVRLIWSDDGGKTWEYRGTVKKPDFLASARSLFLDPDGSGTLLMYLEGGGEEPPGYYEYHFMDYGRTWSKPEYTGNSRKAGP